MIPLIGLIALLRTYLDDASLPIEPGPDDPVAADRWVKINIGPGLGLSTEMLIDQVSVVVEVAGNQNDYPSAEDLARQVDRFFLRQSRTIIDGVLIYSWTRDAGPQSFLRDSSRRWHFTCTYLLQVQSALTV